MKKPVKLVSYAGPALVLAGIIFLAFRPAPIAVELGVVRVGPLQVTVEEQGETRSHDRFVVAAPVNGRLLRILHHDGDAVSEGEVVATLAPTPLSARERDELNARVAAAAAAQRSAEAELNHAIADLEQARRESARMEKLFAQGLVARQPMEQAQNAAATLEKEVEAARFRAQAAAAELRQAQAGLIALRGSGRDVIELRAPASGRILRIMEVSERVISAGSPILVIGDLQNLEVVIEMLSSEAVKVAPGMPALLENWGGDHPLRARVRVVEPYAFTKVSALGVEEKRTNVVLDFVDPPGRLGDGYRVIGRIIIWENASVMKVPVSALFRCGPEWCVYVLDGKRVRRRTVRLGHMSSTEAEVLSGLQVDERVVRHPPNDLTDGARVRPIAE
ncbi:MAG TPA: efflux RND transporter periplasmic adaptor subunit [Steroidobacteraceae bacterium]|nr:efflux RND transporter periplasmic adaptor subunit [Steroidobacteraceae bacterium]